MSDPETLPNEPEPVQGIKKPGDVDYCSEDEFKFRVEEIIKCKNDITYFAEKYFKIIHPDKGSHVIKLYEKQRQLLKVFTKSNRSVVLASRQSGKTTSYTSFVLWSTIFNENYRVLIVSDKVESSIEFLDRIKYAYEELPNWIKPGVPIFNRLSIQFTNGSRVVVSATTPNAGKGKSNSLLIVDEAAAVDPKIMREFWASVYPTISSGKTTKIIMVSSSNGPGNLFYDLYSAAEAEGGEGDWTPFRIDWWEVPGRDDDWKKRTLRDLNNDEEQFNMQFGNQFTTAKTPTLLPQDVIEKYRKLSLDGKIDGTFEPKRVRFYLNSQEFYANMWNAARPDRTYIIGVDIADGVGRDYSTVVVLDVTNMLDMSVVLTFRHNLIGVQDFSRVVMVLAKHYNNAHICAESNGLGRAFFTIIENDPFYYRNIVTPDSSKGKVGILSHTFTKSRACLWMKDILTQHDLTANIYDQFISAEMESFIKKQSIKFTTYSHTPGKNDDSLMALTWALYSLYEGIVDKYFVVRRWMETTSDRPIPMYLEYVDNAKQLNSLKYSPINTAITFNEIYQYTIEQFDESVLTADLTRRLNDANPNSQTSQTQQNTVNTLSTTERDRRMRLLAGNENLIQYHSLIEDVSDPSGILKRQSSENSIGFISRSEWDEYG